jgi:hypothetical protein
VTRTVNLWIRFSSTGRLKATFKVTSDNAGGKAIKKTITVKKEVDSPPGEAEAVPVSSQRIWWLTKVGE